MREIKFRAWDGKRMWHTVTEISWRQKELGRQIFFIRGLHGDKEAPIGCHADYADIHRIKLMQFTGLLDKNGKEIYEGDMVRVGDMAIVLFRDITRQPLEIIDAVERRIWFEAIGNIYENPELLNK